jgi:hypothetical protein
MDDEMESDDGKKQKFMKTQKIEILKPHNPYDHPVRKGDHHKSNSLSKTLSKTSLLNKIRNAIGKQSLGSTQKTVLGTGEIKRKTPRRFIVKRSQERRGGGGGPGN